MITVQPKLGIEEMLKVYGKNDDVFVMVTVDNDTETTTSILSIKRYRLDGSCAIFLGQYKITHSASIVIQILDLPTRPSKKTLNQMVSRLTELYDSYSELVIQKYGNERIPALHGVDTWDRTEKWAMKISLSLISSDVMEISGSTVQSWRELISYTFNIHEFTLIRLMIISSTTPSILISFKWNKYVPGRLAQIVVLPGDYLPKA